MLTCPSLFLFLQLGTQHRDHGSGMDQDCRGSGRQQDPEQPEVSPATLPFIYFLTEMVTNYIYADEHLLFLCCSLSWNKKITEAAWIKIAEAVAASKTLTNLK